MKDKAFNKVLNSFDVIVVAFGAMIGWGWVVSSGQWIQSGGVLGTIIGFIIGGLMIYFVGLTYAELTTALPLCGGEHVFSFMSFGSVGSFICTWALILSYMGVVCYEACSFPTILQYLFPNMLKGYLYTVQGFDVYASWVAVGSIMAFLIMIINIIGIKKSAVMQTVFTVAIAAVGIILLAGSVFSGSMDNVADQAFIGEGTGASFQNILGIAMMTPFFFFGFDVIPQAAEEINVPLKKLGRLMILSIVLAVVFYALVVFSIGLVMTQDDVKASLESTGLVTADAMSKAFGTKMMAKVLIIGGLCGIITSWNSFLIGGSRALYSMADSHMVPTVFSKLHPKFKTPVTALVLLGGLSVLAPFVGRMMLVWIVDAANFACCLAYCMVSISYLVIRKKYPNMKRPYKNKHYRIIGIIASLMSGTMMLMYILPGMGCTLVWQEWIIVAGWGLLGLGFFIWSKVKYGKKFGDLKVEYEEEKV
ncbi:MAG: APC family permease [Oscillospiraceae bacterium]|nr:APC family permease [Oscillospiraceae bacterium]